MKNWHLCHDFLRIFCGPPTKNSRFFQSSSPSTSPSRGTVDDIVQCGPQERQHGSIFNISTVRYFTINISIIIFVTITMIIIIVQCGLQKDIFNKWWKLFFCYYCYYYIILMLQGGSQKTCFKNGKDDFWPLFGNKKIHMWRNFHPLIIEAPFFIEQWSHHHFLESVMTLRLSCHPLWLLSNFLRLFTMFYLSDSYWWLLHENIF